MVNSIKWYFTHDSTHSMCIRHSRRHRLKEKVKNHVCFVIHMIRFFSSGFHFPLTHIISPARNENKVGSTDFLPAGVFSIKISSHSRCSTAQVPSSAQAFHFSMQIWYSSGILVRFFGIAVWLLAWTIILCDSILAKIWRIVVAATARETYLFPLNVSQMKRQIPIPFFFTQSCVCFIIFSVHACVSGKTFFAHKHTPEQPAFIYHSERICMLLTEASLKQIATIDTQ